MPAVALIVFALVITGVAISMRRSGASAVGDKVASCGYQGVVYDSRSTIPNLERFANERVKAIVLRVDSRAAAWRRPKRSQELQTLRDERREDVIWMGSVAASGVPAAVRRRPTSWRTRRRSPARSA